MRWPRFWQSSKRGGLFGRQSRRVGLVSAAGLCLAGLLCSCAHFQQLTRVTNEFPRAELCSECHVKIYHEWAGSPHAFAYSDPAFAAATDNHRFTRCLGCHAPGPHLRTGPPVPRDVRRREGVTCVSCHLAEGRLNGPLRRTGEVAPHPIGTGLERFRRSAFCGRCHVGTFAQWQTVKAKGKRTCQQCHMPLVTRKVTQATSLISKPIVALEDKVAQRRHTFIADPAGIDPSPFELTPVRKGSTLSVTLLNRLPHSFPTGDFGLRVAAIELEAADGKGGFSILARHELVQQLRTAAPPGSTVNVHFTVPATAGALRVRLVQYGKAGAKPIEILTKDVAP